MYTYIFFSRLFFISVATWLSKAKRAPKNKREQGKRERDSSESETEKEANENGRRTLATRRRGIHQAMYCWGWSLPTLCVIKCSTLYSYYTDVLYIYYIDYYDYYYYYFLFSCSPAPIGFISSTQPSTQLLLDKRRKKKKSLSYNTGSFFSPILSIYLRAGRSRRV